MAEKMVKEIIKSIKPGSKEMEAYLSTGYGFDKEGAQIILDAYKANPLSVPYEKVEQARGFMAALTTKPTAVSTKPAWKRTRSRNK